MRIDLGNLPTDTALLHQLVRDMAAVVERRDGEIERLQQIIKKLQRMQFGRSAERLDPGQLALALEDLDADIGRVVESHPVVVADLAEPPAHRKPLPEHLPREEVTQKTASIVDLPPARQPLMGLEISCLDVRLYTNAKPQGFLMERSMTNRYIN